MQLYLTARGLKLTPAIRRHVESRIVRSVQRLAGNTKVMRLEVQLYRPSHRDVRFGCHVLVHLPGKTAINIREEAYDLYETIDNADNRLVRHLVDTREKIDTLARFPTKYYAAKLALGDYELRDQEVEIELEELAAPFLEEEAEEREPVPFLEEGAEERGAV